MCSVCIRVLTYADFEGLGVCVGVSPCGYTYTYHIYTHVYTHRYVSTHFITGLLAPPFQGGRVVCRCCSERVEQEATKSGGEREEEGNLKMNRVMLYQLTARPIVVLEDVARVMRGAEGVKSVVRGAGAEGHICRVQDEGEEGVGGGGGGGGETAAAQAGAATDVVPAASTSSVPAPFVNTHDTRRTEENGGAGVEGGA